MKYFSVTVPKRAVVNFGWDTLRKKDEQNRRSESVDSIKFGFTASWRDEDMFYRKQMMILLVRELGIADR